MSFHTLSVSLDHAVCRPVESNINTHHAQLIVFDEKEYNEAVNSMLTYLFTRNRYVTERMIMHAEAIYKQLMNANEITSDHVLAFHFESVLQ